MDMPDPFEVDGIVYMMDLSDNLRRGFFSLKDDVGEPDRHLILTPFTETQRSGALSNEQLDALYQPDIAPLTELERLQLHVTFDEICD